MSPTCIFLLTIQAITLMRALDQTLNLIMMMSHIQFQEFLLLVPELLSNKNLQS